MEYDDDDKEENHVFIPTAWTTGIEVFPLLIYNEIVFNLTSDASAVIIFQLFVQIPIILPVHVCLKVK
jgi:hypothetical protein